LGNEVGSGAPEGKTEQRETPDLEGKLGWDLATITRRAVGDICEKGSV